MAGMTDVSNGTSRTAQKNILKALAHFETGAFGQYPDGLDDLLSEQSRLWYDLWEFVSNYLGTVW